MSKPDSSRPGGTALGSTGDVRQGSKDRKQSPMDWWSFRPEKRVWTLTSIRWDSTHYACDPGASCTWGDVSSRRTVRLSDGAELEHAARGPYEWDDPEFYARQIGDHGQVVPTITEWTLRDVLPPPEALVLKEAAACGSTARDRLPTPEDCTDGSALVSSESCDRMFCELVDRCMSSLCFEGSDALFSGSAELYASEDYADHDPHGGSTTDGGGWTPTLAPTRVLP